MSARQSQRHGDGFFVSRPREEAALPVRERVAEDEDFDRVAIDARNIQRSGAVRHQSGPFASRRYALGMTTKIEVLEIEGMSCGHCVKSVQSALAAVPGVTSAKVTVGHAEVESSAPREALVRAIEAADFTVKGAQA